MGKYIFKVTLFFICFGLTACNEVIGMQEKFVVAEGNTLYLVDLSSSSKELLYEFPRGVIISENISSFDSQNVFFGIPSRGEILMLDVEAKEVQYQLSGRNPVYIKEHNKLVYYGVDQEGSPSLLISDVENDYFNTVKVAEKLQNDLARIVRVSADEFVFEKNIYNDLNNETVRQIWKYNIVTQETEKYDQVSGCSLLGIWRSSSDQLLCSELNEDGGYTGKYFLTSLDGSRKNYLDFDEIIVPGIYSESDDLMFYSKSRVEFNREIWDLWVYDFISGEEEIVLDDVAFSVGAIAYLEKE